MGAIRFLFSPHGRINRAKIWLYCLIALLISVAEAMAVPATDDTTPLHRAVSLLIYWPPAGASRWTLFVTVTDLALLWAGIVITLKRLHDRGKGAGWLILMWLVPTVSMYATAYWFGGIVGISQMPPAFRDRLQLVAGVLGIFSLWAFIELYLRRGEAGANRFGPSPLAKTNPPEAKASGGSQASG